MKLLHWIMTALLVVTVTASPLLAAAPEGHDHSHAALDQLELNNGEKWASDQHMRRGMDAIRKAFATFHDKHQHGGLEAGDYQQLAGVIDDQVEYMFANCQLAPEPDHQLHIILANLMRASETMKSGENPYHGLHRTHQSLHAYGEIFQDAD